MNLFGVIKSASSSFIDFLAPKTCLVCNSAIKSDNYKFDFLCSNCYNSMPFADVTHDTTTRLIGKIPPQDLSISKSISLFDISRDSKYMDLIYAMKYQNYRDIGKQLGRELAKYMQLHNFSGDSHDSPELNHNFPTFDVIIPVPLHHAKKRERGYNQSDYIAMGISEVLGIECNTKAVRRRVYTESQTTMNNVNRTKNIIGAFEVKDNTSIKGKRILLVDDVFTTGSTLNSLALAVRQAGATVVFSATLAQV